jgi:ABC-type phosphate transport system substrate-binding protein
MRLVWVDGIVNDIFTGEQVTWRQVEIEKTSAY